MPGSGWARVWRTGPSCQVTSSPRPSRRVGVAVSPSQNCAPAFDTAVGQMLNQDRGWRLALGGTLKLIADVGDEQLKVA